MRIDVNVPEILKFIETETDEVEAESCKPVDSLLEEVKCAIDSVLTGKYDSQEIRKKIKIANDGKLRISVSVDRYAYTFEVEIYINRTMDNSKSVKSKSFRYKPENDEGEDAE